MEHGKPVGGYRQAKRPYCPFNKFCVFLRGEDPAAVLEQRDYFSKRVDELEFAMDIANRQYRELLARNQELEEKNTHLTKELSEALQAPFKKYEKKDAPANAKKRGAPVGHPGWFRRKPENIDRTIDVFLDTCPICGSVNISPCNHTTEHIQKDTEEGKVLATRFVHWSSRHNMVPNFRFHLFFLFLYPFGCRVSQYLNHVRNLQHPSQVGSRTGAVR